MSGGSYDYFYYKLEQFAEQVEGNGQNERRKKFAELMKLCSIAARSIELVDSNDYGPGDENEDIDNVFKFLEKK